MSITAFFAVCILGIDFMIYFFFKLLYPEKKGRVVRRRLPPEYYDDDSWACRESESSPVELVRAQKNRLPRAMNVLSMPAPQLEVPGVTARQQRRDDAAQPKDSAELVGASRIVSLFAHAGANRKAS